MSKYYNHRNSKGQFTRRVSRAEDGRFAKAVPIVAGRLYGFRGATVRASRDVDSAGSRWVTFHKTLGGWVKENELIKINTRQVNNYLDKA